MWTRLVVLLSRLRALVFHGRADEDFRLEADAHLELLAAEYTRRGMMPDEARTAALRQFGSVTHVREIQRDQRGFPGLDAWLQDLRFGSRMLRKSASFSAVVVVTLALGIGVNTAIFSVVRAVLLKPLPYPDAERLVWLGESTGRATGISVTWINFNDWRAGNHTFEDLAAFQYTDPTLTGRGEPIVTRGMAVTPPYFALLGMRPLLGRLFDAADDRPGAPPTIVLSHPFWASQLGGDPHIVGTTVVLGGRPLQVIGVAAPVWQSRSVDYYLPLGRVAGGTVDRGQHGSMRALGRLKPSVTLVEARADLDAILRHLSEVDPGPENEHRSAAEFLGEHTVGDARASLLLLMGAVGMVLLIACANVGSLLLARNTARATELAVRKALGAGRLRLVRQLLTETILIAAIGGAFGVALAFASLRFLIAIGPSDIPRLAGTTVDLPVLLFALVTTVAAGLVAGLAPALTAGKLDLATTLKEGVRTASGGARRQLMRNLLVVAEVALTLVLAFGSGLLVRSLIAAQHADPGFDPQRVVSFGLQLPGATYKTPAAVADFYARLTTDVRTIPGVVAVSSVHCPPGAGDCGDWFYSVPERPAPARNEVPVSLINTAAAGYFKMMAIPVQQGREFDDSDTATSTPVAVVNAALARLWWPSQSAVGHQIKLGGPYIDGPVLQIVGVTGDVKQYGLDAPTQPEIFLPFSQQNASDMVMLVRAAGDPAGLMPSVRGRVAALDRDLPIRHPATIDETLGAGLARRRFSTLLLTLFAALAMLLAGVGIYGLMMYWVNTRESEIAIRLALGARPSTIVRWITGHALRLAGVGIALGMAGGWAGARGLDDLVFGIAPRNPATMMGAALVVAILAVAATALPAWRATRVDPARRLYNA